ncbi:MAG: hypothetical protein QNJ45_02420 [Ardenticatenaceae bacterium]|nr:hypothetical protein [Ardenticatenaceae bacterium]
MSEYEKNDTAEFLGHRFSWSKAQFSLEDVQALHGGVKVSILSWGDYFVHQIAPDGEKISYKIPISSAERDYLVNLFVEQDFVTIKPQERMGIPDEARPVITLRNSKGRERTVSKWAGEKNERFDELYQALKALAAQTEKGKLIKPRFNGWQKGLTIAAVGLAALLPYAPAYLFSRWMVPQLWPGRMWLTLSLLFLLWVLVPAVIFIFRYEERRRWNQVFEPNLILIAISLIHLTVLYLFPTMGWTAVVDRWGTPGFARVEALDLEPEDGVGDRIVNQIGVDFSLIDPDDGLVQNETTVSAAYGSNLSVGDEIPVKYFRPAGRWVLFPDHLADTQYQMIAATLLIGTLLLLVVMRLGGPAVVKVMDERF